MRFDLVFPLIDLGHDNTEWYQAAAKLMIASARHAYAGHDMRIVQLTDKASQPAEDIDVLFTPAEKVEREHLAQYRGHCAAEWALQADRPVILCDVDLLWNNDTILGCFDTKEHDKLPDIVLTRRTHMELQPFNGGLILTQPHQLRWWEIYRDMMKSLPKDIRGWWGDQIGLAVMMGHPEDNQSAAMKFGSHVAYLPLNVIAPSPKEQPTALLENPCVHMKGGKRKPWLTDYFMMLQAKWQKEAA